MADKWDGWYDNFEPKISKFEVPHYKTYNSIEGIWQLEHTRDTLAKRGLKDPWMRNEIWKYPKWYTYNPLRTFLTLLYGEKAIALKRGFAIATTVIIAQNVYWRWKYGKRPAYIHNFLDWLEECHEHFLHPNQ